MSRNTESMTIRLPLDLIARVEKLAEPKDKDVSKIVRQLLIEALDLHKQRRRKRAGKARSSAHGGAAAD